MPRYEPELRSEVVRKHLEEGRTIKSLTEEYNLGQGTVKLWLKKHREECQLNPETKKETDTYAETLKLRKELAEARKEIEFLKKAAAFFAKEIG